MSKYTKDAAFEGGLLDTKRFRASIGLMSVEIEFQYDNGVRETINHYLREDEEGEEVVFVERKLRK